MTGEARDIRDALAEALWRRKWNGPVISTWSSLGEGTRLDHQLDADRLLAALPSVKLMMVWEE